MSSSVPGVQQLAYLQFEVKDLAAWEQFSTRVLGLDVVNKTESGFRLRMDARAQRFFITQGPADDCTCLGWECASDADLDATVARLRGAGVDVREGTAEERALRGVRRLYVLVDPAGNPTEISCGPALAEGAAFASRVVRGGFVADGQGLGHAVVRANSKAESTAFYRDLLGFKHSDDIVCEYFGHKVDLSFFHANTRHHSLAFGEQQKKRIHHFMLEVKVMDDVGLAFDRTLRSGNRIMQTLGKHPNDQMFSFYARTPSGFQFELGFGGRQVDDATWTPTTYDRISEWGHHPPEFLAPKPPSPPNKGA
jgi:2,3-dihydroxybiphenyl 1,2-dioxygenase